MRVDKIRKEGEEGNASADADPLTWACRELFQAYEEERGTLPATIKLTPGRVGKCKTRLQAHADDITGYIANFRKAVVKAAVSDFCCGRGKTSWKLDFDFLIENDKNMLKVLGGKYDNSGTPSGHQAFSGKQDFRSGEFGDLFEPSKPEEPDPAK